MTSTETVRDLAEIADHNRAIEAEQLRLWATKPAREVVYIVQRPDGLYAESWLGTVMCKGCVSITSKWKMRTRSGELYTLCAVRFVATNGATYTVRFGSDWAQACAVRRSRI